MTETKRKEPHQAAAALEGITHGALWHRGHPDYQHPTSSDVAALKAYTDLTGKELGRLAGVDDRGFRRYLAPEGAPGARKIPYSVWRLLLILFHLVPVYAEPDNPASGYASSSETQQPGS